MARQEAFNWCRQQYGTEPEYPWMQTAVFCGQKSHIKRPVLESGRAERGLRPANQYQALSQKAMLFSDDPGAYVPLRCCIVRTGLSGADGKQYDPVYSKLR